MIPRCFIFVFVTLLSLVMIHTVALKTALCADIIDGSLVSTESGIYLHGKLNKPDRPITLKYCQEMLEFLQAPSKVQLVTLKEFNPRQTTIAKTMHALKDAGADDTILLCLQSESQEIVHDALSIIHKSADAYDEGDLTRYLPYLLKIYFQQAPHRRRMNVDHRGSLILNVQTKLTLQKLTERMELIHFESDEAKRKLFNQDYPIK